MNPPNSITTAASTDSSTASSQDNIEVPTLQDSRSFHQNITGLDRVLSFENNQVMAEEEAAPTAAATAEHRVSFKDDASFHSEESYTRHLSKETLESSCRSDYEEEVEQDQYVPVTMEPVAEPVRTFKYKPAKQHPDDVAVVPSYDEKPATSSTTRQRKSTFQNKALGHVSKMYDLENKGYLTEEERLMREMDVDNRGYLTKEQVYEIVRQKLEEEHDVKQYKMASIWMLGFMVVLTIAGFGTSYTSAILSKEINADVESGAVLVKNTDTVIGFDAIGDTLEFSELTDVEYSERRERVLREMNDEDFMQEHQHRRLANKKHGYTIVFDQGKVPERDLEKILQRCDAGNVVNIQRTWKNPDGSIDKDFDTICGPDFTVVNKKGTKNKNRKKVRTTMEQVLFRKGPRKNADDEGDVVSFVCEKGWCYASGSILQQSEGHPCTIQRGHEECRSGLLCYAGESITSGTGVCTKFAKNRKPGQFCDISYGLKACEDSSMCEGNLKSNTVYIDNFSGQVVGMGTCSTMTMRARLGQQCDASHGKDACLDGLECMDLKGKKLQGRKGTGICGKKMELRKQPNFKKARWYVDYDKGRRGEGLCVRDCPQGKFNNCGGNAANHDEYFETWKDCCAQKLWWLNKSGCVPDWPVVE
jgi:hypothetical protein